MARQSLVALRARALAEFDEVDTVPVSENSFNIAKKYAYCRATRSHSLPGHTQRMQFFCIATNVQCYQTLSIGLITQLQSILSCPWHQESYPKQVY